MPDHKRLAAEIIADFERQHLIPEEMRAEWLRRCVEEQLWFVAETAKSFGEQEGYGRALATDPLRRLLGTKAVEALLAGEAGVVPIAESIWGSKPFDGHCYALLCDRGTGNSLYEEVVRLDTPSETAS